MARNFVNLSDIVNDYILTMGEDDYGKGVDFIQLMTWGKQAVRDEISIDLNASLRSERIAINKELSIAVLPTDYINYSKIGLLSRDCKDVIPLGLNDKLNLAVLQEGDCTPPTSDTDNTILWGDWVWFSSVYKNGGLYGIGGGNNRYGYYRINKELNRIELDVNTDSDFIILEYLADESATADPKVPVAAEQFLINWLIFQSIKRKLNVPQSAIAEAERRAYLEKKKANYRLRMFSKSEAASQINRRFQLSPKFLND